MLLKQIFTTPKPRTFSIDSAVVFLSHPECVFGDVVDKKRRTLSAKFNDVGGHAGTFAIDDCQDEPVELISIDSLGLSGEIIIKADVEGFEERLIRGAKETIVKSKPKS